ncbi:hypothetical protein [Treponema primitia]|uniref:hypothetical protein n=1 Tax=Treponema primitia TaxID=88058 RepID=UPI0002554E5B|nr:hypothetical protein [Treponema primitia]
METKEIRFINSSYKTLFTIKDGDEIEISLNDGSVVHEVCQYIDEYHLRVGSRVFHIGEFAELREKLHQSYKPVTQQTSIAGG